MAKKPVVTRDIKQEVTNRIIAALEQGVMPWKKNWNTQGGPKNAVTCRRYSGINVLMLWMTGVMEGYTQDRWLTAKQAFDLGGHIEKGDHGTTVVLLKRIQKKAKATDGVDGDETKPGSFSMLRHFTLFNVDQIKDLPEKIAKGPALDALADFNPIQGAESLMAASGAKFVSGGDTACYIPSQDIIRMPERTHFHSEAAYYGTLLHELTHWTGHESRLNRDAKGRFGTEAYAFEELVAEMGTAFLCAHLGIEGHLQHAEYIGGWLKVLKNDKQAIFTAASQAEAASQFLLERAGQVLGEDLDEEIAA